MQDDFVHLSGCLQRLQEEDLGSRLVNKSVLIHSPPDSPCRLQGGSRYQHTRLVANTGVHSIHLSL